MGCAGEEPFTRIISMEWGRTSSKSILTRILAQESLAMDEFNISLCRGFPKTLPILDKHAEDKHLRGRFGNLTQTETLVISEEEKSKYSSRL